MTANSVRAILFLLTIAVYAQVRNFEFVNYDDPDYVANPHVQNGLTADGVKWAFTSTEAANWFPITRLSHLLDAQLFRSDAGMHHLVNVVIHAFTTLLVFAFFLRATQDLWRSAFVAFLFALHPLHVESIAWIAERKDVLSAFFFFLGLWCYVRYTSRLPALAAFCCGLMAKPMAVTFPLVLLLLDIWPLRRPSKIVREKLPFLAIASVAAVGTYLVQQDSRAVKTFDVIPLGLRIENALVSYATYILKTFWAGDLAVFYPYPQTIPIWEVAAAAALLTAISVIAALTFKIRPYLAVGWCWFLITLLPVIGLIQVGAQAHADRYMYIPMTGLAIMLAWGFNTRPLLAIGAAVLACIGCLWITSIQIGYWRNTESLFTHALVVTTRNYVAEHNLGLAMSDDPARLPDAIAHYRAALAIRPDSVEARTDLGTGLAKMGQFDQAIAEYQTALQLAPDCEICRKNLQVAQKQMAASLYESAVALQKSGRNREAIDQFKTVLGIEPDFADAHNNLGVALANLGRVKEAIEQFKTALRLKPDYEDAKYNLDMASKQP